MLTSRIRVRVCGSGLRVRGIVVVEAGEGEWLSRGGGRRGGGRGACGGEGKKSGKFFGEGCQRRLLVF